MTRHIIGKAVRVVFFSVVTSLLMTAFALAADQAAAVGTITGTEVRMRSEPSTSSSILTMMDTDYKVAVTGSAPQGWYAIAYNGSTGYVSADYLKLVTGDFESPGRLNASDVNVRSNPTTESGTVGQVSVGSGVTVTSLQDGWYGVTLSDGTTGYIRSDFVDLTASLPSASSGNGGVVSTAMQYLGTRYVYGGASPSGFDCSGFTMYIYKQFGVSLPHTATGQWQSGKGARLYSIGELAAGDLVFFNDPSRNAGKACSHAGIYIGNGQFVHSSSSRSNGVIVSDLTSGYYNQYFVGGMRIL